MSLKTVFALTIAVPLVMTSCSKKREKHSDPAPKTPVKEYFSHGDPHQLIKGAQLNGDPIFNLDNLESFRNFHATSAFQFTEREEKYNPQDWDEVESNNSTEAGLKEIVTFLTPVVYEFKQDTADTYIYQPQRPEYGEENLRLRFKIIDETLELISINDTAVKVLHYSLKDDGKAFSILVEYEGGVEYGTSLLSMAFAASDDNDVPFPEPIGDYAFLFGNVPLAWEKDIVLDACGDFDSGEQQSIRESLNQWFQDTFDTGADTIPVKLNFKNNYAPFSDLNDHCLMLVSNFKLENSDNFYVAGVDLPVVNKAAKTIIDSDIFIFMDHKTFGYNGSSDETASHEIGHFFGLGHEFSKDEGGASLYESIMGYSEGVDYVTDRDFEAIRAIYNAPLSSSSN